MATPAVLPVTSLPGWPNPPIGLFEQMKSANGAPAFIAPDGVHVADSAPAQAYFSGYVGSAAELTFNKQVKQASLDTLFDANFVLTEFIRNGTVTTVTGANVGAFIAQINNNYRTLRASIAAATTVSQVQAININAGWPANP